jgi:hypothetical protein
MNYERVYEKISSLISAEVPDAVMVFPNNQPAKKCNLEISINVSEIGTEFWTEKLQRKMLSIDNVISVPLSKGTERINNVAAKIQSLFSPIDPQKTNIYFDDGTRLIVRSSQQLTPNINEQDSKYQINVRIEADAYVP